MVGLASKWFTDAFVDSARTQAFKPRPRWSCTGSETRTDRELEAQVNIEFRFSCDVGMVLGRRHVLLSRMNPGINEWLSAKPQAASISGARIIIPVRMRSRDIARCYGLEVKGAIANPVPDSTMADRLRRRDLTRSTVFCERTGAAS
jgi:hypothetical protein